MKKIFIVGIIGLLFIAKSAISQEVTMEKTMDYLNKKLQGKCSFTYKEDVTIEFFDKSEKIRQDKFFPDELDTAFVSFSKEENAIVLKCSKGKDECIQRKIYKNDTKKFFSRMTISMEGQDQKSIDGMLKAFKHMIRLSKEKKYKLYEYFE